MSFHGPQPPIQQQGHTQPTNRNESFNVAPGGFVESFQPHGFSQIQGIWVDNFSGGWLSIEHRNLWVPPYTRGWKASILPSMSAITIRSYDFANGVVIAGANGTAAIVTLWNEPAGDSDGIEFYDAQTVPLTVQMSFGIPSGVVPILPAPPVGRYRIYEVAVSYAGGSTTSDGILANFRDVVGVFLEWCEISPASPLDRTFIISPGGDLPIGSPLQVEIYSVENIANVGVDVAIFVRYAVR